jgi:signal transduction histidine kinase
MDQHQEDSIRPRYHAYQQDLARQGTRWLLLLAITLFPAFAYLDYFAHPEQYLRLWAIRFSSTLLFILILAAFRSQKLRMYPFVFSVFLIWSAACSITLMCLQLGGYQSPYYAGVNLVILAAVLLIPAGGKFMSGVVAGCLVVYIFGILSEADFRIADPPALINNLYFLFGTSIIGVVAASQAERLRREAFYRNVELERIQADLKLQQEIKSKFFANVSHELRTPLTLILGPLKGILKRRELTEEVKTGLQIAERNAEALLRQVGNLLDVSRLDAGETILSYSLVDIAQHLRSLVDQFQIAAQQKGIELKVQAPPSLMVAVDALKVERIIINLLSNAFKFTPSGGRIHCDLMIQSPDLIRLTIGDSGQGIPDDHLNHVFHRFYQSSPSDTRKVGGTGLGLAIAREFTLLHGGSIKAGHSKLGGAEICLELPSHPPEGTDIKASSLSKSSGAHEVEFIMGQADLSWASRQNNAASARTRPLIVVVEDNADMSDYILSVLEAHYDLAAAFNGQEGLRLIRELQPDLIMTDIMMPDCSGEDLLEEIRKDSGFAAVPIIVLTAKADDELRVRILQKGAQDYILKPFIPEELEVRVENLLSIKRSRELLQLELTSREHNIEALVREVTERQRDLSRAKQEAELALELREEFISLASHELNTPLTSLHLQTQVARKKALAEKGTSANELNLIDSYDSQLKRLVRLVNDMLDISRLKSGKFWLERSVCEITSMMREVIERLPARSRELIVMGEVEPIYGFWDHFRMEQVLLNLLTNAVKYGEGKPVEVKIWPEEDQALIEVKDMGIGIAEEKHQLIFERFERAVAAKDYSGLGLGLYITKQIIEAHGGTISLRSELGKGSTFILTLPCKKELDDDLTYPALR